ncbi:hypothetical protein O6H91_Y502800 [Diphasiastrum complanatum]|nr:hypothetical protein O6H91_Y502800 [Diphasiastrum complanatum]
MYFVVTVNFLLCTIFYRCPIACSEILFEMSSFWTFCFHDSRINLYYPLSMFPVIFKTSDECSTLIHDPFQRQHAWNYYMPAFLPLVSVIGRIVSMAVLGVCKGLHHKQKECLRFKLLYFLW